MQNATGGRKLLAGVAYLVGLVLLVMAFLPALTPDPGTTALASSAAAPTVMRTVFPTITIVRSTATKPAPTVMSTAVSATTTATAGSSGTGSSSTTSGTGNTGTTGASNVGGAAQPSPSKAPTTGGEFNSSMPFLMLLGLVFLGAGLALSRFSPTTKS